MLWFKEIIVNYAVNQAPSFLNIIIQFGKGIVHRFENKQNVPTLYLNIY